MRAHRSAIFFQRTVLLVSSILTSTSLPFLHVAASAAVTTAITETVGAGSLGTQVQPPSGGVHGIRGGTTVGANLFHSFREFTVGAGEIAQFQTTALVPDLSIRNILNRVTGPNPSSLFGTIDSVTFYPNANFFLMNPAGILFGPTAVLNVGGAVHFTTADYLRLGEANGADAGVFHASSLATSLLTSAPVAAFGFLGASPAAIQVEGSQLVVAPGAGLSLVGGDISIGANPETGDPALLSAPSGRINLASVASAGEILLPTLERGPNINGDTFSSMGSMTVRDFSNIDASGSTSEGTGESGTIRIRGGQLELDNFAFVTAVTQGDIGGEAPSISVHIDGNLTLHNTSGIVTGTGFGIGRDGGIEIIAGNISMTGGSLIQTLSGGPGATGDITIRANTVSLSESRPDEGILTNISTLGGDATEGGTISISGLSGSSESLTLNDQTQILTSSLSGRSGDVQVNMGTLSLSGNSTISSTSAAAAGDITLIIANTASISSGGIGVNSPTAPATVSLSARNIILSEGANINGQTSASEGGHIQLSASDTITIQNSSTITSTSNTGTGASLSLLAESIRIDNSRLSARSADTADGGNIDLTAINGNVELSTGAIVTSSTGGSGNSGRVTVSTSDSILLSGGSIIESSALSTSTGNAGNILLQGTSGAADSIRIEGTGSGIFSETRATGSGGDITTWSNELRLTDHSTISSKTSGSGNAGDILIKADDITINGGATITAASTGAGNAGAVTIQGAHSPALSFLIEGTDSGIFTNTENSGKGGDISIDTATLTMQNGGTISAATSGTNVLAAGGSITVTASQSVDLRSNASISSRSIGGADAGNIKINAGNRFEAQNSSVTTRSENAGGGDIEINALDRIRLVNSQVNASAFRDGGNITIDPNSVILQNSQILAQAVQGNGGNITITTPVFLADPSSLVDASSQFGLNGTVNIQSPTSNLSGTVGQLSSKTRQMQTLLQNRCAALAGGEQSTFILAGRDTLPAEPGGWLGSPLAFAALSGETGTSASSVEPREARGEGDNAGREARGKRLEGSTEAVSLAGGMEVLSLRRMTPPGFLIQAFATDGSTGCRS